MVSEGRFLAVSWAMAGILVCSLTVVRGPADAGPLHAAIDGVETALLKARAYLGNYPAGSNDPNPVRRRFLGSNDDDRPIGTPSPGHTLASVVEELVHLSQLARASDDHRRIDDLLNQATQLSLQGWVISGNMSLMEGLRVSYPRATGGQARPQRSSVPYGSLERDLDFVSIKDATRANLFYDEGVRVLLASLTRRPVSDAPVIVAVDTTPIPSDKQHLPGAYDNQRFPQYTWYLDRGHTKVTSDDRIVPIQTQGYLMGNLLYKQGQATQSIGYRLWTAAYFSRQAQNSAIIRDQLLDGAVSELHGGANTQFLSSIALAATVGDDPQETLDPPYQSAQLHRVRTNVQQARNTIKRIRAQEKPALPIDEIMAGDAQVNTLLATINDPGGGPGSVKRAEESYEKAKAALYRVQQTAEKVFAEEQTRQDKFLHLLEELTGEPIFDSRAKDVTPETLRTSSGQTRYLERVANRINTLMASGKPDFGTIENRLEHAVQRVVYHRQGVLNKKAALDSYPRRIQIIEDTLGKNISAIRDAEGKITAAQLAMGIANSVTVTETASVSVSVGLTVSTDFSAGISVTRNPGAIYAATLQNDITRASNLKETQFRQNEASAGIRNLLLDQDMAHGELKTQLIRLGHAEDSVNKVLGDTQRILAQLRAYDEAVAGLWYNDPVWNIELTGVEEEANGDMASLVANLYKLGRMLEIRWTEPFANPLSVTIGEPVSLGSDFDNFHTLESVFALPLINVRDYPDLRSPAKQARSFLSALKAWDKKLREQRNFEGDLPVYEISLRQDVFGLADVKTVNGQVRPLDPNPSTNPSNYEEDQEVRLRNIRRFQNILINNGREKEGETGKPRGFLVRFPLRYHANGFTNNKLGNTRLFGNLNAWNYRLNKLKLRLLPLAGKSIFPAPEVGIYFAQAGTVENIDFFERSRRSGDKRRLRTYNLDNYVRYDAADLGTSQNSPYLLFSFARQHNFADDKELPRASDMAGRFWSPFSSRWLLQVNAINNLEIENIDDLWIEMTLTSGQPSCPIVWREHCQ